MTDTYYDELNGYKYVSFDLFDTLIFRCVGNPKDIHVLVGEKIFGKSRGRLYAYHRNKAESKARKLSQYEDITLDDIYSQLRCTNKEIIKIAECNEEIDCACPNADMVQVLNRCRENGSSIIITTDMYLPREIINKLLDKAGVKFDFLFISGECGVTKRSGKLFDYIINYLEIDRRELVHVGDNQKSDYDSPKKKGIKGVHYQMFETYPLFFQDYLRAENIGLRKASYRIYRSMQFEKLPYQLGYSALGPTIVAFCDWMHKIGTEKGIQEYWFIARDGFLLKKIYEILYPLDKDKTRYLRLNKKVLRFPLLNKGGDVKDFMCMYPYLSMSVKDLIQYMGIDEEDCCDALYEGDLSLDTKLDEQILSSAAFDKIWKAMRELKKEDIAEQYELILRYISKYHNENSNHVAIINNSINGNIQYAIEKITCDAWPNVQYTGFQFVQSEKCKSKKMDVYPFLEKLPAYDLAQYNHGFMILEHLIFEQIGTAKTLIDNGENVDIVCEEIGRELENKEVLDAIQSGSCKFAKDYSGDQLIQTHMNIFRDNFFKFLGKPSKEEANLVGALYDTDLKREDRLLPDIEKQNSNIKKVLNYRSKKLHWTMGYFAINEIPDYLRKTFLCLLTAKTFISKNRYV